MAEQARILVVDDEVVILEICSRILSAPERMVETAASGDEALTLLGSGDYDVVLTDLRMPGKLDGGALFTELKRRSPATDVIVMTGQPSLDTAIPMLREGLRDYLPKPFDRQSLLESVERCMARRRRRQSTTPHTQGANRSFGVDGLDSVIGTEGISFCERVCQELSAPLASIFPAVEQIRHASPDSHSQVICGMVEERMRRLQESIETIRQYSELMRLERLPHRCSTNAREILERVITRDFVLWQEKDLSVQVSWEFGADLQNIDEHLMEKAYENIFRNAIVFNRKGGSIKIHAGRQADRFSVSFADTGIGIPTSAQRRIFEGFYRMKTRSNRMSVGVGLGLAVVKRVVELHGGTIHVESQENEGSTFTILFPSQDSNLDA